MIDRADERMDFNKNPDEYHLARPGYPDRVFELLELHGLRPGSRVLEIGPGTGQATSPLLARGAQVTAVEPGTLLAAKLGNDLAGPRLRLRIIEADFETATIDESAFDLAVAATSFHWLDTSTAVPKLARLVRPGGVVAVWWQVFGDPDQPATPFHTAVDQVMAEHLPSKCTTERPGPMQREQRWAELTAGDHFEAITDELIRWRHDMSAAAARRLYASFPNLGRAGSTPRDRFLDAVEQLVSDDFGGTATDCYVTAIYLARRRWDAVGADDRFVQ